MGDCVALIYHRNQVTETSLCTSCFQKGHTKKNCTNSPACIFCKEPGHKAREDGCIARTKKPHKSVMSFHAHTNPLSNFYPVKDVRNTFGLKMPSAEHAYQYSKAIQAGQDQIAKVILTHQKNGKLAKDEAAFLSYIPDWDGVKETQMKQILQTKAKCCPEFRKELLNTESNILAEAV